MAKTVTNPHTGPEGLAEVLRTRRRGSAVPRGGRRARPAVPRSGPAPTGGSPARRREA